jgi:predicted nucleic acid-binding protein
MHDREAVLVSNTTPLLALTAAMGNLDVLKFLYQRVVVPAEVADPLALMCMRDHGIWISDRLAAFAMLR